MHVMVVQVGLTCHYTQHVTYCSTLAALQHGSAGCSFVLAHVEVTTGLLSTYNVHLYVSLDSLIAISDYCCICNLTQIIE